MRRIIPLAFFMMLGAACFPAIAGELEDRAAIAREVSALFEAGKFDEIDRMADEFGRQESRSGSGLWKLSLMYRGLYVRREGALDESYFDRLDTMYMKWVAQNPDSTVAHIGYASNLINRAWFFRGNKWGRDVPEDAWKSFFEYLDKAHRYMLEHKSVADKDPVWYHNMLVVAKGENWPLDRFLTLVEEGTAKHPYFYQIYYQSADYLLPQWHGDRAMIEEFANLAVEKTRKREGVGMYARIYWHVSLTQFGSRLFTDSDVVWEKMSAGIDDVLARYPDQWNINNFARFACLARDREKARELLDRIEGAPIAAAWGDNMGAYKVCRSWLGG